MITINKELIKCDGKHSTIESLFDCDSCKVLFDGSQDTKNTIINGKKYTVSYVFNGVGNWYFTDKDGVVYLVDGEDVTAFGGGFECEYEHDGKDTDGTDWYICLTHDDLAPSNQAPCSKWVREPNITVDTAIAYAKHLVSENESGIFWWKIRE